MTPNVCIAVTPRTLRALMDFQRDHCKENELCQLADLAIHEWLERQLELAKPAGQRGYFWKALFLPEGTRLRIASHGPQRLELDLHPDAGRTRMDTGTAPALPQGALLAPQRRHDCVERRHAYRRAEDLLLD